MALKDAIMRSLTPEEEQRVRFGGASMYDPEPPVPSRGADLGAMVAEALARRGVRGTEAAELGVLAGMPSTLLESLLEAKILDLGSISGPGGSLNLAAAPLFGKRLSDTALAAGEEGPVFYSRLIDLLENSPQKTWKASQLAAFMEGKVGSDEMAFLRSLKQEGRVNADTLIRQLNRRYSGLRSTEFKQPSSDPNDYFSLEKGDKGFTIKLNSALPLSTQTQLRGLLDELIRLYGTTTFKSKNEANRVMYALSNSDSFTRAISPKYASTGLSTPISGVVEQPQETLLSMVSPIRYQSEIDAAETRAQIRKMAQRRGGSDRFRKLAGVSESENPHWGEAAPYDVFVSNRSSMAKTKEGKSAFINQENQSDLHQKVRSRLKSQIADEAEYRRAKVGTPEYQQIVEKAKQNPEVTYPAEGLKPAGRGTVFYNPSFKNTEKWTEMGLRKALREAVDKDSDYFVLTSGEQHLDRYAAGFKNPVSHMKVSYEKDSYHPLTLTMYNAKKGVMNKEGFDNLEGLYNYLSNEQQLGGQKFAEKVIEAAEKYLKIGLKNSKTRSIKAVEGATAKDPSGMREFYDTMVPKVLEKIIKKYKIQIKPIEMRDGKIMRGIELTPEIKQDILKGQPLAQQMIDAREYA